MPAAEATSATLIEATAGESGAAGPGTRKRGSQGSRKRGSRAGETISRVSSRGSDVQPWRKRRHSSYQAKDRDATSPPPSADHLAPVDGSLHLRLPASWRIEPEAIEAAPRTSAADLPETNLGHFRPSLGTFETLIEGEFTIVNRLAGGINGDVFAYRCTSVGRAAEDVAVKKLRPDSVAVAGEEEEIDERRAHFGLGTQRRPAQEDALAEVGVLRLLSKQPDLPRYLLHYRGAFIPSSGGLWLVTELAEGGDLLAEVQRRGTLPVQRATTLIWQLLQAVAYLHKQQIAHRDISLENVLLKRGEVRLMDFGAAVNSQNVEGMPLRYFRAVGKDFYRAPECYVPLTPIVEVVAPEDGRPGEVATVLLNEATYCEVRLPADARPGASCRAAVWGYEAPPADVWSTGICAFMLLVGCPAWGRADNTNPLFAFASEHGLAELLRMWGKPALPAAVQALIDTTTKLKAIDRPTAADCLQAEWFQDLQGLPVALHDEEVGNVEAADSQEEEAEVEEAVH